jgi:hypothetical protein
MSFEPIESYGVIGVHHFAINIQLQLLIGRVSDTHGPRVFIPQRALRLAEKRSLSGPFDTWLRTRDAIREDIFTNFWDDDLQSFVQSKGTKDLDASVLHRSEEFLSGTLNKGPERYFYRV